MGGGNCEHSGVRRRISGDNGRKNRRNGFNDVRGRHVQLSAALFAAWIISEVRSADTAVFGGGNAPGKKTGASAEAAKINSIVLIRFPLHFIANLKTA